MVDTNMLKTSSECWNKYNQNLCQLFRLGHKRLKSFYIKALSASLFLASPDFAKTKWDTFVPKLKCQET